MPRILLAKLAALGALLPLAGCALHGQPGDGTGAFAGDWLLIRSFGVTAPADWRISVRAAGQGVTIRSQWQEPTNGQYALTLLGLGTTEFSIDPSAKEQAAQVGPFVMRYRSHWEHKKLITQWWTSEFMASSFQGKWIRAVSKDGSQQTVDIEALARDGEVSRASLTYQRQ